MLDVSENLDEADQFRRIILHPAFELGAKQNVENHFDIVAITETRKQLFDDVSLDQHFFWEDGVWIAESILKKVLI